MEDLMDRVVVITGGASGVGRGMAEAFSRAGAQLVLTDIHDARLKETSTALDRGKDVLTVRADVRDRQQLEAVADQAYTTFGAIHILCNNAGVASNGLVWEQSADDFDWIFDTNVRGVANGLRTFVPRMLETGEPGHIVNTSSMLGLSSAPLTGLYGASKQAVLAMTEALRFDLMLISARIGVSVLCPGPVRTNVAEEPGRPSDTSPPDHPTIAQVDASLKAVIAEGMEPYEVGECVVDAVRADRFWILPAPEYLETVEKRLDEIRSSVT